MPRDARATVERGLEVAPTHAPLYRVLGAMQVSSSISWDLMGSHGISRALPCSPMHFRALLRSPVISRALL